MDKVTTINDYIAKAPEKSQEKLQILREIIKSTAPDAEEAISYMMPTFKLHGKNLIHFAAFRDHISVFPTASNLESELPEVEKYRTGKGTLQFPNDSEIPFDLIKRIVQFRVNEMNRSKK